jgi:hypothetical protein
MAGAGAGGEGARREATRRVAAGRAAAGAVRRAGVGVVFFGAVTVTSGSVSDTWPQAGRGEVRLPSNGNAPKAAALKIRRSQIASRDELRLLTRPARTTPPNFPECHPDLIFRLTSRDVLARRTGTFVNVSPRTHLRVPSYDRIRRPMASFAWSITWATTRVQAARVSYGRGTSLGSVPA